MKQIRRADIESMEKVRRLNLVNSITGYKPANLIGTRSTTGVPNLAIISSVMHLSSSPAMIGFMQRPTTVPRHTYSNIRENGWFTINHVPVNLVDKAHYTSAKFPEDISEFDETGLTEEYRDDFYAPFVKESQIKLAATWQEDYHIKASNTILVVGRIECIYLPDEVMKENGQIDLEHAKSAAISGLNTYHEANTVASFPYAKPGNFPENIL